MTRAPRVDLAGHIYHVLNRANLRKKLFEDDSDYTNFLKILKQSQTRFDVSLFAFCLMPNHWHLVLRPNVAGEMQRLMAWIGVVHTRRHNTKYRRLGQGHVYQGRYKSFLVQDERHLLLLCRYVERNALRAGLVRRSGQWRWSSAYLRATINADSYYPALTPLEAQTNEAWLTWLDTPRNDIEALALQNSLSKGVPFGDESWISDMVDQFGLHHTIRGGGRPTKNQS